MLTQDTKRKIDSARDILVGKVPDPKAQVEQITTALIYKFMDDMDKGSQELGGKARFFTNGYEKYAWTKLMDPKLGGHDRYDLYDDALKKLSLNPHIPQLFRDIFKDAFLPYRNPETLSLFLKEINGFTYEHSEDLGDSFEYLLSVLGSQGDAGQFRTPRHIIDFIVEAIDPKKDDIVCDPACGTAGFLISAYKHILRQHDGKNDPENKEKPLTPDERKKLMDHFTGYDISPDMVRLSRVNLYLHGFPNPTIYEYDTLTSEEKWDESFDVMLANPPFMTPKGGIKPHKRFSVQANRSEVLFVDYMLEHLRRNGRAGIIVPEGIIFQSANAYKALRKMLVEDGLLAVVSLPAGVFQPYSGVKTGILLFDKALAKKTHNILFIKIENDGYDLGAQRREIDKNDLPQALGIIKRYKTALKNDKPFDLGKDDKKLAHLVIKGIIAESGDYNLSGDRYKEVEERTNQKWSQVGLGEVLDYEQPTKYIVSSIDYDDSYKTPVLTAGKTFILGYTNEKGGIFEKELPVIIFDDFTTATKFVDFPFKVKSSAMKILHAKKDKADIRFLFYVMQGIKFSSSTHKRYWISQYSKIKIPLPPIEVQKEIVEQIEVKQQAINHAKAIIKNLQKERAYFGQSLRKLGCEWVELEKVCEITSSKRIYQSEYVNMGIPFYRSKEIIELSKNIDISISLYIAEKKFDGLKKKFGVPQKGDLLITAVGSIGFTYVVPNNKDFYFKDGNLLWLRNLSSNLDPYYLRDVLGYMLLESVKRLTSGGAYNALTIEKLKKLEIPLPPLEIQKQLVVEAEREEEIITANRRFIELMDQKIQKVLEEI